MTFIVENSWLWRRVICMASGGSLLHRLFNKYTDVCLVVPLYKPIILMDLFTFGGMQTTKTIAEKFFGACGFIWQKMT